MFECYRCWCDAAAAIAAASYTCSLTHSIFMYKYIHTKSSYCTHTHTRTHYFYDVPHGYKVELTRWKMLLLLLVLYIVLYMCWLCVLLASFLAWLNALDVFAGYRMSKTNSNHIINMRAPNAEQNTQVLCESHFSRLLFLLTLLLLFFSCLRFGLEE